MKIEYKDGKLYVNDLVFREADIVETGDVVDEWGCNFCLLQGKCKKRYWKWEGDLICFSSICGSLMYVEKLDFMCRKLGMSVKHLIPTPQSCRKISKFSTTLS